MRQLIFVDLVVTAATHGSPALYTWIAGKPRTVLSNGIENHDQLRAEQLSEGDLEHLMRQQGYERQLFRG